MKKTIDGYIKLLESNTFKSLKIDLDRTILKAKRLLAEKGDLLISQFRGNTKTAQFLPDVTKKKDFAIEDVHKVECRIIVLCRSFGVDPAPLLRSDEIEVESPHAALAARKYVK